jgi:CRISPR-associated protein Cmr1
MRQSRAAWKGIAAFWLLTHLGGIGSRSRRCAGGLQATGDTATLPFDIPQTAQALQDQLTRGIQAARRLFEHQPVPLREAAFDALSPATCRIWILCNGERPWANADAAMRDIGASLQDYRREINPIQRRKIFGLPLMGVDNRNRRSSPLLLRITKLQGEQYVGVAVLFKTKAETRTEQFSTADYTLIDRWVTQDFPKALEVKL